MKKFIRFCFSMTLVAILGGASFLAFHLAMLSVQFNSEALPANNWEQGSAFDLNSIQNLEVNHDGSFRIMVLGDLHLVAGILPQDTRTLQAIRKAIVAQQPNLVVALGDVVNGFSNYYGLIALANLMEELQTNWAYVFGTKDGKTGLNNVGILNVLKNYPHSLTKNGPTNITGNGNYNLHLTNGANIVYQLNFLDSHGANAPRYIKADQIAWLNWVKNGVETTINKTLNSVLFTHLPIQEYSSLHQSENYEGEVRETLVVNKSENSNLFAALKQMGSVKAMFAGHYHLNTLRGYYDDIYLANVRWSGHSSYWGTFHPNYERGVTIINLDTTSQSMQVSDLLFKDIA